MIDGLSSFGVNTYPYMFRGPVVECLEGLTGQGFLAFEAMVYPGHLWPAETNKAGRQAVKRFCEREGARILSLNLPNLDINIGAADTGMRRLSINLIKSVVQLAGDLDVPCVMIGPGKSNPLFPLPFERMTGYLFEALDVLCPVARSCGTSLAIENLPIAFLPDAPALIGALNSYGDPDIGIVYDAANATFYGENPADGLRLVQSRLRLLHVSDTARDIYRHGPIGTGAVDFAQLPPVLREVGYRQPTVLEIISTNPEADIPAGAEALLALGWNSPTQNQTVNAFPRD